ncbi:MAG: DUF2167 domain-containing protein [Bacteroidota bacterium]
MKNLPQLLLFFCVGLAFGQTDSLTVDMLSEDAAFQKVMDSINQSYTYQQGTIDLADGLATLNVPEGFKFLDSAQSHAVLTDLWGNPPSETLGMLFPEDAGVLGEDFSYAIEITYSEDGYIDDEDAADLDYDDLLDEMKSDVDEANAQRKEMGYGTVDMIGWAAPPHYDSANKKLYWAKELHFEDEEANTLNYNIRILGRKGYLNMNAISEMDQLALVEDNVEDVLTSVEFNEGYRYADFNPDLDEVAAYGIGGLIAGKVLAKAGFFALLLKFWKVIAVGAVAVFGFFRKALFGSKEA